MKTIIPQILSRPVETVDERVYYEAGFMGFDNFTFVKCEIYVPLKIFNEKTAILLNYLISNVNFLNDFMDDVFYNQNTHIYKNYANNFYIFFWHTEPHDGDNFDFYKNVSKSNIFCEASKFIFENLKMLINKYLEKIRTTSKKVIEFSNPLNQNELLQFDERYLEILKEHFTGTDLSKKFTKDEIFSVIGEEQCDPFKRAAAEQYFNEIEFLKNEKIKRQFEIKNTVIYNPDEMKSFEALISNENSAEVKNDIKKRLDENDEFYDNKINEIVEKIESLTKL
jgi:hypothetical protein